MALHAPTLLHRASRTTPGQRLLAAAPLVAIALASGYLMTAAGSPLGEIVRAIAYGLPAAFIVLPQTTGRHLAQLTPPMPNSLVIAGLLGSGVAIVLAQDTFTTIPGDALRGAACLCLLPVLTRLQQLTRATPPCDRP